jgi:hypothetical protein
MTIGFHFLLLAIGEVLKVDNYVTAQKLQDYVAKEDAFGGIRVPLGDCRLALELMENSGFIMNYGKAQYRRVTIE